MPKASSAPRILQAAKECLIEGQGNFEMLDVTNRVGVSEGLIYHYFKSKAGLITAIVTEFYNHYSEIANRPVNGNIPWLEREEERLKNVIDFLYEEPLTPLLLGGLNSLPEAAAVEMAIRANVAARSIRNIQSGQKQGVIPAFIDASIAGPAAIGAMNQALIHALSQSPRPPREKVTQEIWRIIRAIVSA